jgi:hypothetical protein
MINRVSTRYHSVFAFPGQFPEELQPLNGPDLSGPDLPGNPLGKLPRRGSGRQKIRFSFGMRQTIF